MRPYTNFALTNLVYTGLKVPGGAIKVSKEGVACHLDLIPLAIEPGVQPGFPRGVLGTVFFDHIVDSKYMEDIGRAMIRANLQKNQDSFQKLISQVMAMETKGTAWIFAPADLVFDTLPASNTWYVYLPLHGRMKRMRLIAWRLVGKTGSFQL